MNYSYNLLLEKIPITDSLVIAPIQETTILVPNNCLELIIPLDGIIEVRMVGSIRSTYLSRQCVYFIRPRRKSMKLIGNTDYLIVKCHPGYTKYIIKGLEELSNGIFESKLSQYQMDDLLLSDRMQDLSKVNEMLEAHFDLYYDEPNELLLNAIDLMRSSYGSITIKEVYTELQVSKSTLEQRFNKDIGLTPKEYCKIEKLNYFISKYMVNKHVSLTETTYQCGYYDQSHLIKDFNYFVGTSPKKFLTK